MNTPTQPCGQRDREALQCGWASIFTVVLAAVPGNSIAAAAAEQCRARLEVTLEPSVPNARDPSFLSGLAANPVYTLLWVDGSGSTAVYELKGPATDYRCEEEINRIRRNASVMDLKVLAADAAG
jgi:hypothetical protein